MHVFETTLESAGVSRFIGQISAIFTLRKNVHIALPNVTSFDADLLLLCLR